MYSKSWYVLRISIFHLIFGGMTWWHKITSYLCFTIHFCAGDNILSVVRALVLLPDSLLYNPGSYKHGAIAFFDLIGIVMVVVPTRLLMLLNYLCCFGTAAYLGRRLLSPDATGTVIIFRVVFIRCSRYCFLCIRWLSLLYTPKFATTSRINYTVDIV